MSRYRRDGLSSSGGAGDPSASTGIFDSAGTAGPSGSAATGDAGAVATTSPPPFSSASSAPFGGASESGGSSAPVSGDGFSPTTGASFGGDGSSFGGGGFSSSGGGFGSPSTSQAPTTLFATSPPPSTFTPSSVRSSQAVISPTPSSSNSPLNPTSNFNDASRTTSPSSGSPTRANASGGTILSTSFATFITTQNGVLTTIFSPVATLNIAAATSSGSSTNSAAIAGAVVGAVGLLTLCIGLVFCYRWRQRRRSSRSHRLLPTPRSVLLADEDNFDLAADHRQQTGSRGIFGSIVGAGQHEEARYSDASPSTQYGSTQVYNPSSGHAREMSYGNVPSLASMDVSGLSGLDNEPPPRLMRARASQTGSMFEELGVWPPPGEGSRLSDPLMAASNVDLTSIVENVMGPGEGLQSHGSGTSTPIRPSRLRGGAESENLLAHLDSDSRSPTEASHHGRSRESTLSVGPSNSPGFIQRDFSGGSAPAHGGNSNNNERTFTYQSSELGSGEGSASPDSPSERDRWLGQSVMHTRDWSGSFTSQSALLPHSDPSAPPPSAFRSSFIFTPPVNHLPPGAAPAAVPGYSTSTPPGSPGKPSSPKYWVDRAPRSSTSSSKAAEAAEERRRSRLSQLAISNPDEEQALNLPTPLRKSLESPLPPIPVIEHDLVTESPEKLVDETSPMRSGTLSVPDKGRNASLASLPSVYSHEEDVEPSTSLGSPLNPSRSVTMSTASPGPSRQTTVTVSEEGMLVSPSSPSDSPTASAAVTRNSTVSTAFSPAARARLRASEVQVPFPSALADLGRFFNSQSGSSSATQQTHGRERDILEEIPPRYDMLRRDSESKDAPSATQAQEDTHPGRAI